jgi:hypothetical protein
MIASENLYIEKGENLFSKYMSQNVERAIYKNGTKVSDLYIDNSLHGGIYCLLEVRKLGYKRNTAF